MKSSRSRSGFLYIASHPAQPGWLKLGMTRRAPSRRLLSLSSSNIPQAMVLHDAVFMWDVITIERWLHDGLRNQGVPQQKEFFQITLEHAQAWLDRAAHTDEVSRPRGIRQPPTGAEPWATWEDPAQLSQVEDERQEWLADDALNPALPAYIKDHQQRELEKASAQGSSNASMLLAQVHMKNHQPLTPISWQQGHVLFKAAHKQGEPEALIVSLWWKSQWDRSSLPELWKALRPYHDRLLAQEHVSTTIMDMLETEQASWVEHPERALSWQQWCATLPAPTQSCPLPKR